MLDRNSIMIYLHSIIFINQEFKLLLMNLRKVGTITQSPEKKYYPIPNMVNGNDVFKVLITLRGSLLFRVKWYEH